MRGLLISERGFDPAAAGGTGGPSSDASGRHHARAGARACPEGVRGAQHAQQGEPSRVRGGGAEATMHIGAAINVTTWGTATPSHETIIAAQEALLARHPRRHPPQGRRGPPGD